MFVTDKTDCLVSLGSCQTIEGKRGKRICDCYSSDSVRVAGDTKTRVVMLID